MQNQSILSLVQALSPEHIADPYPIYQQLRSEHSVRWDESLNAWVVTGYTPVVTGLRDSRLSAERTILEVSWFPEEMRAVLGPAIYALTRQMIFLDPPDHTRLRSLAAKAFTPRVVEAMRTRIQNIVNELLDKVQEQGRMELIQDFAYPLPAIVIAEMLGVPPGDRSQFIKWTNSFGMLLGGHEPTFEVLLQALHGVAEFIEYFRRIIAQRRVAPKDDLMQAMIEASEHGDRLSEEELLGNCVLLLAAGHGTTTHLISNGMLALLRHPDQLKAFQDDPSITSLVILELLRYDSPVQLTSRIAKEELTLSDKHIDTGQRVIFCLGAANRDPAQFAGPDQLDLKRQENRQVAFGHGIHYCLGAPLARLEAEIAFSTLTRRLKEPHLETSHPEWFPSLVFRGMRELEISFV